MHYISSMLVYKIDMRSKLNWALSTLLCACSIAFLHVLIMSCCVRVGGRARALTQFMTGCAMRPDHAFAVC